MANTAPLKNHPGMWLRSDAAAAINALEDKYGVIAITSAGRTEAEQQELIDRWNAGGEYNRPPYLYWPAMPARTSGHVKDGGVAVDVRNYSADRAKLNEFGFQWYGPEDVVHYTFTGWNGAGTFSQVTQDRQNWLKHWWNLEADGIEGPVTRQVYKEYQEFLNRKYSLKLAVDGIWGEATQKAHQRFWDELMARPSSKTADQLTYADIQTALRRHGYDLVVDNIWGPISSDALADFQRHHGLKDDRIVGNETWDKLNR